MLHLGNWKRQRGGEMGVGVVVCGGGGVGDGGGGGGEGGLCVWLFR